jgi:hypothetical protein
MALRQQLAPRRKKVNAALAAALELSGRRNEKTV